MAFLFANGNLENSSRFRVIFRSFRYRNYRLFFGGQSISLVGTWMQRIAMPWLVYHMTGSVMLLGIVSFAGQAPTFVIAPFAGVLTDRWNRYRVLIASQILAMIQALVLTLLFYSHTLLIWHIILLSVVWGVFNAFDVPSRQSFVIDLVEKKEDLGNAIALNSLMFNSARLIGPSVAGLLLASAGEGICFLINTISYLFVITSLLIMKVRKPEVRIHNSNIFTELKEGFRYTFGFPPIRHIMILLSIVSIMSMPYVVLMPVFSREMLGGGSATYGFLMGAAGFGALLGGLWLASRSTVIRLGRTIPAAAAFFGAGVIALSFSRSISLSLILIVFAGFGIMVHTAASNTILQTIVHEDKRGRVMSFYTMAIIGTAPLGSLLTGSLAKTIGTPVTILAGGLICIGGAMYFYIKLPELKTLVRPIYVNLGVIPEVAEGMQSASDPSTARTPV